MTNQDVIHRMFEEVINLGHIDVVDELFDPDFITETPHGTFDRAGFKQYVADWLTGFPDVHCEVADIVDAGDAIAWSVRAKGTHAGDFMGIPATNRTVDVDSLNIGWFRNGRAHRHKMTMDGMALMGQLGLTGEPPPIPAGAVGLTMTFEGVGQEEYEAAMSEENLALDTPGNPMASGAWPDGLISHYAGGTPNGWCVVDLWRNQHSFDVFLGEQLGPVMQRIGLPEPSVTPFTLYNAHRQ